MHIIQSTFKKLFLPTTLTIVVLTMISITSFAQRPQQHAFSKDVSTIQKYDQIYKPAKQPILFVGSSSVRKWGTLQRDFGQYVVLNRGVGGFVINDLIYFADQLIFKYQPRQIIMYVGENDLPQKSATADTVFNRFVKLYTLIRSKLPDIPFGYIALKPSPSRAQFDEKCKAANKLIKDYLSKQPHSRFIDVYTPMINNGHARKELFVSDMLHMNPKGYAIWKKLVKPYLLKPVQ